jgi:transketolase
LEELGPIDKTVRGQINTPENRTPDLHIRGKALPPAYDAAKPVATRHAYGTALERIFPRFPDMVVLDGEVSNSTYAEIFKAKYPERFFEMYVAEQNMVGTALGLSLRGKNPFVSTFAAFLTRAFDQIRMSQYSLANIKFSGSHAGVSIGEDGSSQMGLEDLAMFRTLPYSVVLYPSDAVSTEKLVEEMAKLKGIAYIRTTRSATPIIYRADEVFSIGGSKTLRSNKADVATIVAAGITLHEALAAYEELKKEGVLIRVIDLYSVKPVDKTTLVRAAKETGAIITVEDHYAEGGLGEAVLSALAGNTLKFRHLAVRTIPRSGKPDELLELAGISSRSIVKAVRELSGGKK